MNKMNEKTQLRMISGGPAAALECAGFAGCAGSTRAGGSLEGPWARVISIRIYVLKRCPRFQYKMRNAR